MDVVADPTAPLPAIPFIDATAGGRPALIAAAPTRLAAIVDAGTRRYGTMALAVGDRISRAWLARAGNPYLIEIDGIARAIGRPGAHLLNLSYEWTCTSAVGAAPNEPGARLVRTLDWPLDGLGRNVVVAEIAASAGRYLDVTWPGFVGVATAMAPGRFAVALNQAPMRRLTPSCWFDWAVARLRTLRSRGWPPSHLLRHVLDTCRTYGEARAALTSAPLCLPAFFSLAGVGVEEACVIERTEADFRVREGPAAAANHWAAFDRPQRARGVDSVGRQRQMEAWHSRAGHDFAWVAPPILNPTTRLAVVADPATGRLSVIGYERDGPATQPFRS